MNLPLSRIRVLKLCKDLDFPECGMIQFTYTSQTRNLGRFIWNCGI